MENMENFNFEHPLLDKWENKKLKVQDKAAKKLAKIDQDIAKFKEMLWANETKCAENDGEIKK
jgi:hypothetical protein